MKLSQREMMFTVTTGFIILFALTLTIGKSRKAEWSRLNSQVEGLKMAISKQKDMIAERSKWADQFGKLKNQLQEFPADKNMDVYWLSVMESTASKNGIVITKRQAQEEKKIGDMYELPIECKDCEGTLDGFLHFLFDLQAQGAMLDVKQLYLKPKDKDKLKGRLVLHCAYSRVAGKTDKGTNSPAK